MEYETMEQYRTGATDEGHDQFSVPLSPDEDGFFGRECPNDDCNTKYFPGEFDDPTWPTRE